MTLEHRLVEACDELEKCKRYYRELDDYFKVIKAERDALVTALKKYGVHTYDCAKPETHGKQSCSCGYDAALAKVKA